MASCILRKGSTAYQRGDADKGETRHADGAPAPLSNHALLIHLSPFICREGIACSYRFYNVPSGPMLRPNGKRLIVVTGAQANPAGHRRLRDFTGTIAVLVTCGAGTTITILGQGKPTAPPVMPSRNTSYELRAGNKGFRWCDNRGQTE